MDWYEGIGVIDFMNNIGRQFRMGTMLSRESVKTRLSGSGMSFTEFTYQAFQAYDWLHLFKKYKCSFYNLFFKKRNVLNSNFNVSI